MAFSKELFIKMAPELDFNCPDDDSEFLVGPTGLGFKIKMVDGSDGRGICRHCDFEHDFCGTLPCPGVTFLQVVPETDDAPSIVPEVKETSTVVPPEPKFADKYVSKYDCYVSEYGDLFIVTGTSPNDNAIGYLFASENSDFLSGNRSAFALIGGNVEFIKVFDFDSECHLTNVEMFAAAANIHPCFSRFGVKLVLKVNGRGVVSSKIKFKGE